MEKLIKERGFGDFLRVNPQDAYRYRRATQKLSDALVRYATGIDRTQKEFKFIKDREKTIIDGRTYSIKLAARRSDNGFVVRVDHESVRSIMGKWEVQLIRTEIEIDQGNIIAVGTANVKLNDLNFEAINFISPNLKSIDGMRAQANVLDRLAESIYGLKEDQDESLTRPFAV